MEPDIVIAHGAQGGARWEVARRALPEALAPYVRSWLGYSERSSGRERRRELPGPQVVLIVEFGPPIRVSESGSDCCTTRHQGGFIAGLDDRFSMTEHDGHQAGIQVNLTPLGARAILDVSLVELSRRVVSVPDVVPDARDLADRLATTASWSRRFRVVEAWLRGRLERASAGSAAVRWATRAIEDSGGLIRVDALCESLRVSRKHLRALFHEHVGLPPKLYAGLVRFDRLVGRVRAAPEAPWADHAFALGFADQPHLAREVRRFSGVSPKELRALIARDPVAPEPQVTNVQDGGEAGALPRRA